MPGLGCMLSCLGDLAALPASSVLSFTDFSVVLPIGRVVEYHLLIKHRDNI